MEPGHGTGLQVKIGRPVVAVFTRLPEPGRVKTRLAAVVGAPAALSLHTAFMEDTLEKVSALAAARRATHVTAFTGSSLAPLPPAPGVILRQAGCDLGARLAAAEAALFAAGASAFLALGSDSPTLPAALLEAALERIEHHDALIAPAEDGGYVLIGTSRPCPGLFVGMPWGTPRLFGATCDRARELGLRLHLLPEWYDVDDQRGLDRLCRDIGAMGSAAPPRTAMAMRRLPARFRRSLPSPALP